MQELLTEQNLLVQKFKESNLDKIKEKEKHLNNQLSGL
jgi:hypothetical protein